MPHRPINAGYEEPMRVALAELRLVEQLGRGPGVAARARFPRSFSYALRVVCPLRNRNECTCERARRERRFMRSESRTWQAMTRPGTGTTVAPAGFGATGRL